MTSGRQLSEVLNHRRAGVLLHPTCLPSRHGLLGQSARRFLDFMAEAGLTVWQTLPLGPTHADLSPYQSLSAHAGNQEFIDLEELVAAGLVRQDELGSENNSAQRKSVLALASDRFFNDSEARPEASGRDEFTAFCAANAQWLDDYCLFCAIREVYPDQSWLGWPSELRNREPGALARFTETRWESLRRLRFEQFLFDTQWHRLRDYASERGILLFGDIPIFVAHDSADVWAEPYLFKLDKNGQPQCVAGVPPDYFSPEGQH
ncbi:unnamed protein product, partial [Ectocarpus sp. 12 AP-2014]